MKLFKFQSILQRVHPFSLFSEMAIKQSAFLSHIVKMIFEFIKGTVNANYKLLDRYNSGLPVNVSYEHNYKDNAVVKRRNAINDTLLADAEVAFIMLAHRTAEHVLMVS